MVGSKDEDPFREDLTGDGLLEGSSKKLLLRMFNKQRPKTFQRIKGGMDEDVVR